MIKRHITSLIQRSLQTFPAVLMVGARQVGKSTLAQQLQSGGFVSDYVSLDDLAYLEVARSDPDGFLRQYDQSLAIDEIQRVPDLMRALKKVIDSNRQPGRYLLTGSANILAYPGVTESLAGRMDIIHIEGLSIGELLDRSKPSNFIDDLFSGAGVQDLLRSWRGKLKRLPKLDKKKLIKLILHGSFPTIALSTDLIFIERWFAAYQISYVERDVRDLSRLLDIVAFAKLFRLAALRTGNLANAATIAIDVGLDQRTIQRYLEILNITYQLNQLHPWHNNLSKRFIKTPKIYMNDSGFATYLAGINGYELLLNHPMLGALAETWIWSELRKLLVYSPAVEAYFYRTHRGKEVDFILSKGKYSIGIEFKFADSISLKDFAGLNDYLQTDSQSIGILLYTGNALLAFSDRLIAAPLSLLM